MKRLFMLLVVASSLAQAGDPRITVSYTRFRLPNGLDVILHEDHTVPSVSVNIWYHVGSAREKPGRTGFAHLFEHLMFMGSKDAPEGKLDQWLEAAGGENNASTNTDRTNYYENVPSNALDLPALPRIRQDGIPRRRDDPREGGRAARGREERAPPELRESAVRSRIAPARWRTSTRPTTRTTGRRSAPWRTSRRRVMKTS